eukprot:scaffold312408_cov30-Attheya_sp.AAC.1
MKVVASGKKKITRHAEKLVVAPPELKRKRAKIEDDKTKLKMTLSSGTSSIRCTHYVHDTVLENGG